MHDATHDLVAGLQDSGADHRLIEQVKELSRTIASMRSELQRLETGPFIDQRIPDATDELDAVVAHTASATDVILAVCEELEQLKSADEMQLQRATTQIYEACSFQDITGQRISKVVGTLKSIESQVRQIVALFGDAPAREPEPEPVASLTNGPQLPGHGMEQADIDKLLADF